MARRIINTQEAVEQPAEAAAPEQAAEPKRPTTRVQINQVQVCRFADGSEYTARMGVLDLDNDDPLLKNLIAYAGQPGTKRQIFIL